MKVLALLACAISPLLTAFTGASQQTSNQVIASFLPPGTRLAELQRFDPKTGKSIESTPAILTGHFISPNSDDIAFAYFNASPDPQVKSLFVTVLHKIPDGHAIVFQKSFYERFLWVQDFSTVGLKILKLPGESTDSMAIATARGASLGVQTELYHWVDGVGMVNIMPSHPSAHHVSFISNDSQFSIKLSFEKYPGEKNVPQPILYRWDGHELARTNS